MTTLTHISELGRELIDRQREKQENPEKFRPIKTNIRDLDIKISGIVEGLYVGIGGGAKIGKTALAQHILTVLSTANRGKCGYFMLEEVAAQMAVRSLTRLSNLVDRNQIFNLEVSKEGFEDLELANSQLADTTMFVGDAYFDSNEIIKTCNENDIQFAVVDYQQLLMDKGSSNESDRISTISRNFVKSRNEHGRTYIMVYQLNEQSKQLGSRSIYRDADLLIEVEPLLDEESEEPVEGKLKIKIPPSRMCRSAGNIIVNFSGAHSRIFNHLRMDMDTMEFLGEINEPTTEPEYQHPANTLSGWTSPTLISEELANIEEPKDD